MATGIGETLAQIILMLLFTLILTISNISGGIKHNHPIHGNAFSGTLKLFMVLNHGMLLPAHANEVSFVNSKNRMKEIKTM